MIDQELIIQAMFDELSNINDNELMKVALSMGGIASAAKGLAAKVPGIAGQARQGVSQFAGQAQRGAGQLWRRSPKSTFRSLGKVYQRGAAQGGTLGGVRSVLGTDRGKALAVGGAAALAVPTMAYGAGRLQRRQ